MSTDKKMKLKDFKTDNNLIYHLINAQQVSLESAIAELVQNSFDAKAKNCFIDINWHKNLLIVQDDGIGFSDEKTIEDLFGTFGKEHQEDNSRLFGRFRIGRSQIFSLGASKWYSNEFILKVDILKKGLKYEINKIKNSKNKIKGCRIEVEFYKEKRKEIEHYLNLERTLENKFQYIPNMKVMFNNKHLNDYLNIDKSNIYENENFIFIKKQFYSKYVQIYNLGIYLKTIYNYPKLSGVLITKSHLNVDISRKEIIDQNNLWKECCSFLQEISNKTKLNLRRIDKISILKELFKKNISYNDLREIRLFKEINNGKQYSFSDIIKTNKQITFCFYKNLEIKQKVYLDNLKISNKIIIIDCDNVFFAHQEVFKQNRTSVNILLDYINDYLESSYKEEKNHQSDNKEIFYFLTNQVDVNSLVNFEEDKIILKEKELSKDEIIILNSLNKVNYLLTYQNKRKIVIGQSTTSEAWTDGVSFIALNKVLLKGFNKSKMKLFRIAVILIHEYTHEANKTELHDNEFYLKFHNNLITENKTKGLFFFQERFWKTYFKELQNNL